MLLYRVYFLYYRKDEEHEVYVCIKAGILRLKQLTNTLKIRILSETSILYLIRYASVISNVGIHL